MKIKDSSFRQLPCEYSEMPHMEGKYDFAILAVQDCQLD